MNSLAGDMASFRNCIRRCRVSRCGILFESLYGLYDWY